MHVFNGVNCMCRKLRKDIALKIDVINNITWDTWIGIVNVDKESCPKLSITLYLFNHIIPIQKKVTVFIYARGQQIYWIC